MHALSLRRPVGLDYHPVCGDLADRTDYAVAQEVTDGRRAEAVDAWNLGIGVPGEAVASMHEAPVWPRVVAQAHTLLYDAAVVEALDRAIVQGVTAPVLVLASQGGGPSLTSMACGVAEALPAGEYRELAGDWHGLPDDVLADQLAQS